MTLSMKWLFATFSITALSITTLCHNAERRYGDCRVLVIVLLNVIMMSVIMMRVLAPSQQLFIRKWIPRNDVIPFFFLKRCYDFCSNSFCPNGNTMCKMILSIMTFKITLCVIYAESFKLHSGTVGATTLSIMTLGFMISSIILSVFYA